jgi:hypothetical protein
MEATHMTTDGSGRDAPAGGRAADPERSGADVVEAVERASAGTSHGGVQTHPEQMKPHAAPVEQVAGDAEMTQGQVVDGPGGESTTPTNPSPAEAGSGGAQSVVGARVSDRVAASEDAPDGPPFTDEGASSAGNGSSADEDSNGEPSDP